jgi:hypothetical protein
LVSTINDEAWTTANSSLYLRLTNSLYVPSGLRVRCG